MNDVTGKQLNVGDNIVFIPRGGYTYNLEKGVVIGFTAKKVKIKIADSVYMKDECLKYPEQVAKV